MTGAEKIVLDKDNNMGGGVTQFQFGERCVEQEFKAIGMASFFDTSEDNNVDWEDLFDGLRRWVYNFKNLIFDLSIYNEKYCY